MDGADRSKIKHRVLIYMNLETPSRVTDGARVSISDIHLPSPPGTRVRIRTLISPEAVSSRETWLSQTLLPALGSECSDGRIFMGRQCHADLIRDTDREEKLAIAAPGRLEFPDCDGLVTRQQARILAIRTADCVPIVVSDGVRPWIGAVHAGWRGTLAGILTSLLACAVRDGSQPRDLHLWVGPHIHACHYQIGEQLSGRFQEAYPERSVLRDGHRLSLLDVNIAQAVRAGVPEGNISASRLCTFEKENGLPSYRRDGKCRGEIITTAVILSPP